MSSARILSAVPAIAALAALWLYGTKKAQEIAQKTAPVASMNGLGRLPPGVPLPVTTDRYQHPIHFGKRRLRRVNGHRIPEPLGIGDLGFSWKKAVSKVTHVIAKPVSKVTKPAVASVARLKSTLAPITKVAQLTMNPVMQLKATRDVIKNTIAPMIPGGSHAFSMFSTASNPLESFKFATQKIQSLRTPSGPSGGGGNGSGASTEPAPLTESSSVDTNLPVYDGGTQSPSYPQTVQNDSGYGSPESAQNDQGQQMAQPSESGKAPVYDEASGLWYDANTDTFFDDATGTYYDRNGNVIVQSADDQAMATDPSAPYFDESSGLWYDPQSDSYYDPRTLQYYDGYKNPVDSSGRRLKSEGFDGLGMFTRKLAVAKHVKKKYRLR